MTGQPNGRAVLVTIAPSHYCEKARWALDRLGIDYEDERHAPVTHMPALARRKAGFTTPILVMDGQAIGDSTAILRHLETLAPPELRLWPDDPGERLEVSSLEAYFDEELGPPARTWAYTYARADDALMFRMMCVGMSSRERAVFHRLVKVAGWAVGQRFAMDEASREESLARVREVFRLVGQRIADGREYLVGGRFTAADLALASLGAPMVAPEGYGYPLPKLHELPAGMRETMEEFRATPTGEFILRLYSSERARARAASTAPTTAP